MTKLINGYTHHTIDECGTVTNSKTGNVKSIWLSKAGYYCVDIHENGKGKKHYLHRLLAENYLPNPEIKRTVNHIDGNKLNNSLTNIEWATDSENIYHAYRTGLHVKAKKVTIEALEQILSRFLLGENFATILLDYDFAAPTLSTYLKNYAIEQGKEELYLTERKRQKIERTKAIEHDTIPVKMIDPITGQVLKVFDKCFDAALFLNKKTSGPISNVLLGRHTKAYGYFWERV